MLTTTSRKAVVFIASVLFSAAAFADEGSSSSNRPSGPDEVYGRDLRPQQWRPRQFLRALVKRRSPASVDTIRYWNQIAIDASGIDHTPVEPGENRVYGEQLGPGRSARAMAIVHIAMFDAGNAILGGYRSYTGQRPVLRPASVDAAVATAAHDTLVRLYPSQAADFDTLWQDDLNRLPKRDATLNLNGVQVGKRAAAAILTMRANDGSDQADPHMDGEWPTSNQPGHWRQDPIGKGPIALGAHWGDVQPFVLRRAAQFRVPPPPAMTSAAYTQAYNEVKALGGDGIHTPTVRTKEQTQIGIFWAYDGTPSLCAPPRLYNQVTTELSSHMTNVMQVLRLYALVNTSMADAGIAGWESKYYYDFWRPVTGIREADEGTGPTGLGDRNPATRADAGYWPLGAPASNLDGPDFTPPFPGYPSGHATFGGALFQVLRKVLGTDEVAFTFTSDEYNGETIGKGGVVRPLLPRSFATLSQAEEENGQSRIYLGIHWQFDKTAGIAQGRKVADYVYANAFQRQR